MTTTIQQQDDKLVAILEGRLDTAAAPKCEQDLQPLYDAAGKDIVFDCTALDYISSSGLRLFLGVLKNAKPKGAHVYVKGMNEGLRNIFTMTGFVNLFEFL